MIISKAKEKDAVIEMLDGVKNVFLLGCSECASLCGTGSPEALAAMKETLEASGKNVAGSFVAKTGCQVLGSRLALWRLNLLNGWPASGSSTMNGWTNEYFRAECEEGTLELGQRWLRVLKGGSWDRPLAQDLPLLQREVWMNSWLAEMYCDWLLGTRESHPTRIEDNIQCAAMVFAAVESAHTHKPVEVQEYLRQYSIP